MVFVMFLSDIVLDFNEVLCNFGPRSSPFHKGS